MQANYSKYGHLDFSLFTFHFTLTPLTPPKFPTKHLDFSLFILHFSLKHALRWLLALTPSQLVGDNSFNSFNSPNSLFT